MTLRERIEAVFRGETPDAMVWFADLTYWYGAHQAMGDLPAAWRGPHGIGQIHREMNVGEYVPGCNAYDESEGSEVAFEHRVEAGVGTRTWRTPVGTIDSRQEYSPSSFSWGFRAHPVKRVEDLAVVRYVVEHRQYRARPDRLRQVDRDVGAHGLPVIAVPGSPMAELGKAWAGIMDLSYLMADTPGEVGETLEAIASSQDETYRITAESECPYVMICENLSAETMGGLFDLHTRDYLTRRVAYLHAHGKKVILHIDGTLRGVVEKLPAVGIDCLDAVTPKPVGDVGMDEIRDLVGDDILILGGMPGAMFAPPFTAADIETHVRDVIRLHKQSNTFMFGVADQVPPNGDLQLVKLVSDLVEQHGRYAKG